MGNKQIKIINKYSAIQKCYKVIFRNGKKNDFFALCIKRRKLIKNHYNFQFQSSLSIRLLLKTTVSVIFFNKNSHWNDNQF